MTDLGLQYPDSIRLQLEEKLQVSFPLTDADIPEEAWALAALWFGEAIEEGRTVPDSWLLTKLTEDEHRLWHLWPFDEVMDDAGYGDRYRYFMRILAEAAYLVITRERRAVR